MDQSLRSFLSTVWDTFFLSLKGKEQQALRWIFLASLYLAGVFLWDKTFGWGRMPLDFLEWAIINIPRIDFVRDALRLGVLPLHMLETSSLHDVSDRFFTLPDVITTPQMILLVTSTSTLERLRDLGAKHPVVKEYGDELEQAYEFLMTLRVHHQFQQMSNGTEPDNFINPDSLSSLERNTMKESFKVLSRIHDSIEEQYRPGMVRQ